jgi:hypothetical protein
MVKELVKCELCGKLFKHITYTHLKAAHGITTEEYKTRFPNSPLISEETLSIKAKTMIGKNVGNIRKDAEGRMKSDNPMGYEKTRQKMSSTKKEEIKKWVVPFFNGGPRKIKIKKVRRIPTGCPHKVYNFEVSPNNTYIANRVVVHNCFADYFRHSLYTSFFDNSKEIGLRHCNISKYKEELAKLLEHTGEPVSGENTVTNAIRLKIPMRLGIRFEDFPPIEKQEGISLELMRFLAEANYPVMINTKSDMPGDPEYVKALADNKGKAAVHITLISSDEAFLKDIEPGAPTFERRIKAAKNLSDAGVRVVARIEPWMIFLNDEKDKVDEYIGRIKEAGVEHMTFDSYSYSANSKGLAQNFHEVGIDFRRMFLLSADSQPLSSFLLGEFMDYFQLHGLSCSTFDQGNVPRNDDWICCSVGDWFEGGFNWGSGVIAIKYIQSRKGSPVGWSDFEKFVLMKGGWLSSRLRNEVRLLWNGEGDAAWPIYWGQGIEPAGHDEDGVVWIYNQSEDFRKNAWKSLTK